MRKLAFLAQANIVASQMKAGKTALGSFQTTHWTVVLAAVTSNPTWRIGGWGGRDLLGFPGWKTPKSPLQDQRSGGGDLRRGLRGQGELELLQEHLQFFLRLGVAGQDDGPVVGRCTSTICTAQNFSSTARVVSPPATAFKRCRRQTCST